jgi:hypothetical protein
MRWWPEVCPGLNNPPRPTPVLVQGSQGLLSSSCGIGEGGSESHRQSIGATLCYDLGYHLYSSSVGLNGGTVSGQVGAVPILELLGTMVNSVNQLFPKPGTRECRPCCGGLSGSGAWV